MLDCNLCSYVTLQTTNIDFMNLKAYSLRFIFLMMKCFAKELRVNYVG